MIVVPVASRVLDTSVPRPSPAASTAPPPPVVVLETEAAKMTVNRQPVAGLEVLAPGSLGSSRPVPTGRSSCARLGTSATATCSRPWT
jgi:hypothetical protein